jgi:AraC-like DNA-binding protein
VKRKPVHDDAAPPAALIDFVLRSAQVRVYTCTHQRHEHGYTCAPRTTGDHNLLYVTRGKVTWWVDEQPQTLERGDLLIVPAGALNRGRSERQRMTLGSIHILVTLPGGQDVFALLRPPLVQRVRQGGALDGYLRGAMREFETRPVAQAITMIPGWALLIALELVRDGAATDKLRYEPIDSLVIELLGELTDRIVEPTTLADLAALSGYSAQHLNRVFRAALGVTPLQYLHHLRMERAAALLLETNLTVRGVGARVGFDDPYYFSRQFRAHFDRSPAQYREQDDG